jgi:hypothetical protein
MKQAKILYWAPRLFAIFTISFTSLFALDVFGEGMGVAQTLLALLMHLLPQIAIVIVLLIAWRKPIVGGILFILLGFLSLAFFGVPLTIPAHFILTLPMFLIGILFIVQGRLGTAEEGI